MASVKNLKKDINYILGDIIEECYSWELMNPKADTKKSQAIIEEALNSYDALLEKVNAKKITAKKEHFKNVDKELETIASKLIEKINKL